MNVFSFSGNLGRDSEIRVTQGGAAVCNFAVAATSGYGDNKKTEWISCALWGKQAEGALPSYLKKGQSVAVSGELSTRDYVNQAGEAKTVVEVRCNSVTLIGVQQGSNQPAQQQGAYQQQTQQHAQHRQPPAAAAHRAPAAPPVADSYEGDIPF